MSYEEPHEDPYDSGDTGLSDEFATRWPLDWHGLYPRERWLWFEQLWADVCALRDRYRLPVRCGWWEHQLQVEALAARAAWVARYDSGEWDDPPGKLMLLHDLERVSALLRDGDQPFSPRRDRDAFARHLIDIGCEPPSQNPPAVRRRSRLTERLGHSDGGPRVEEALSFEDLPPGSLASRRAVGRWSDGSRAKPCTPIRVCEGDHGNSRLMTSRAEMHCVAGRSARGGAP